MSDPGGSTTPSPKTIKRRGTDETRLLAMVDRATKAGSPSPTNDQICGVLGFASTASAARLVAIVVGRGLVDAHWPDRSKRSMALTAAGHARLAAHVILDLPPAGSARPLARPPVKRDKPVDVSRLPPVGDGDEVAARNSATDANRRFLAALAKVAPVPDAIDRDRGRFNQLPPPALTGEAFS